MTMNEFNLFISICLFIFIGRNSKNLEKYIFPIRVFFNFDKKIYFGLIINRLEIKFIELFYSF